MASYLLHTRSIGEMPREIATWLAAAILRRRKAGNRPALKQNGHPLTIREKKNEGNIGFHFAIGPVADDIRSGIGAVVQRRPARGRHQRHRGNRAPHRREYSGDAGFGRGLWGGFAAAGQYPRYAGFAGQDAGRVPGGFGRARKHQFLDPGPVQGAGRQQRARRHQLFRGSAVPYGRVQHSDL